MPDLVPYGARAHLLGLDPPWRDDIAGRVALARALSALEGVVDVLVTESSALLVSSDASGVAAHAIDAALARSRGAEATPGREHDVEVVYDGADLDDLARTSSRRREELVARHTARTLVASFVGFLPGFAYLRGLDDALASIPRRASPRARVPRSAVAVAAGMGAIYPAASAGGWQLLGRAPRFDGLADPIRAGDRVRFRAIEDEPLPSATAESSRPEASEAWIVEAVSGPALLVDAVSARRLADGAPAGGPLVPSLARAALTAVGGGTRDVVLERLGAITLRSGCRAARWVADERGRARRVAPDETITIAAPHPLRAGYVAFEGGLVGDELLGARGTILSVGRGGHRGRVLRRGDRVGASDERSGLAIEARASPDPLEVSALLAARGPHLLEGPTRLRARIAPASDRTGARLVVDGSVSIRTSPATTTPALRGAIQATPSGELIVLGPDHPVTAGYPIVGVLDDDACDALFARPPGAEITITYP